MTGPTPAAPRKRNTALVALDIVAGVVLLTMSLLIGLSVLTSATLYGGLQAQCGAGPFEGLHCNSTVLAVVVYGLIAVAVIAFFLGLGFFVVGQIRRRYSFYWPLAAIVLTLALFYLGTWVASLTTP